MMMRDVSRQVEGSTLVTCSPQIDVIAGFLRVPPRKLRLSTLLSGAMSALTPAAFHSTCDNKGPTLTLLRCGKQYHGGYASVSWNCGNQYLQDPQAFLFRFKHHGRQRAVNDQERFDRNGTGNELYAAVNYGPVFGYKHDLFTFGHGQQPLQDVRHGNSPSFNVPSIFYDNSARVAANTHLEVFRVDTGGSDNEELEEPWLSTTLWTPEVLSEHRTWSLAFDT